MPHLSPEFWLQVCIYLVGVCGAVAVLAFQIGQMKAEFATKTELKEKVRERDEVIKTVFKRFDEIKEKAQTEFVRKEFCGQLHVSAKDDIKRLDDDYRLFRHELLNTVQKIYDRIDGLRELISKEK